MSSTKPTAKRRAIVRWGVVITALTVLAAGCSQSENGASDGSKPETSTSQAGLSSAASHSPATRASVEEEPLDSSSEIATTTTSLPPAEAEEPLPDKAVVESALSDEAIRLIGVGVDACVDLYEFRCGRVLWDACAVLHEDLESVSEEEDSVSADRADEVIVTKEVVSYVKNRVCRFMDLAFYSELSAVLSARYGEAYYKSDKGFYGFRDQLAAFFGVNIYVSLPDEEYPEILDGLPEGYGTRTEWGRNYIPEVVRPKLGQLFYSLYTYAISENSVNLKSENEVSRILAKQKAVEAVGQCDTVNDVIFHDIEYYDSFNSDINQCISELCSKESGIYAIGCHTGRVTIETKEYNYLSEKYEKNTRAVDDLGFSKGVLFWQMLKYVCATALIHDNYFMGDDCRRAAFSICKYWNAVGFSFSDDITDIGSPACNIGNVVRTVSYTAAIDACYDLLETFLTTKFLLFDTTNSCSWASEECAKYYRNDRYPCEIYRRYFNFEIIWKNIPLLCTDNNSSVLSFSDSNCYNALKQSCRPALMGDYSGVYGRYHPNLAINEIRSGYTIRRALCSYLFYPYERDNVSDVVRSNNLLYIPQASSKIQVGKDFSKTTISLETTVRNEFPSDQEFAMLETIPREFPSANIDFINVAATECDKGQNPQSECIEKIWQSCFNILLTDPNINWELAHYVCTAAWIAELARMASALLSSFPEDYQIGSFYQFLRYITAEAVERNKSILTIDEGGTARPNLNRDGLSSEDGTPEITEALLALGNSIAQLVQPYLRLPTANQQRDI